MGDGPALVHAVAAEAAAELVEDAAPGHVVEGGECHVPRPGLAAGAMAPQQQEQVLGAGKLGGLAEAAVVGVEGLGQAIHRRIQGRRGERPRIHPGGRQALPQGRAQLAVLVGDLPALVPEGVADALHQFPKRRQAVAGGLGEVGAAEEGRAVRCEEHGQGPAARAAREHLVGQLVDLVQVGPFLPVHLDADEQAVHEGRHVLVLEGFMGHDMAPVAGGIADGQQDGLVVGARPGKGRLVPRLPVHGVGGVLQEVGGSLGGEAVGHGGTCVRSKGANLPPVTEEAACQAAKSV